MGLLNRLFGGGSTSKSDSKPDAESKQTPDLVIEDDPTSDGSIHGKFQGERVIFESESSPNGRWKCLYGRTGEGGAAPIVLVSSEGEIQHAFGVTRAKHAAVSNVGHIAVTDIGDVDSQELGGTLDVVGPGGESLVEHEFESNIWHCAITESGRYASTATNNPDRTVYVFDVESGDIVTEYESELNGPDQEFGEIDGEVVMYLLDNRNRYRGINLEGETVWRSPELENQDRYEELREQAKKAGSTEVIDFLEEAYELADDEYDRRPVARDLGDAHWNLAKEIRKEEGDTDEWWSHLNQAKSRFAEVLSWYDGKKGYAKVSRKQAKYHLKEGNEEVALDLWQEIANLEEEYDVQLLTDTDRERIEELSS